jgi:hypothetical protein
VSELDAEGENISYQRSSESYEAVFNSLQLVDATPVHHVQSPAGSFSTEAERRGNDHIIHSSPFAAFSSPGAISNSGTSPLYQPFSQWPLKSREEAGLLRHFSHHLADWVSAYRILLKCTVLIDCDRLTFVIKNAILALKSPSELYIILSYYMLSLLLLLFTEIPF